MELDEYKTTACGIKGLLHVKKPDLQNRMMLDTQIQQAREERERDGDSAS